MSTRPTQRTARTATITLVSAVLLSGVVSGTAAADPPALDRDPCAVAIAPAASWPGTIDTAHHQYRVVSDAYDSYLARQAECRPEIADR
jgi:hypothetical protein